VRGSGAVVLVMISPDARRYSPLVRRKNPLTFVQILSQLSFGPARFQEVLMFEASARGDSAGGSIMIQALDVTEQSRGRMARSPMKTKRYPSDLTGRGVGRDRSLDAQAWAAAGVRGRWEFREVINAGALPRALGCGWRMLPLPFRPVANGLRLVPRIGAGGSCSRPSMTWR